MWLPMAALLNQFRVGSPTERVGRVAGLAAFRSSRAIRSSDSDGAQLGEAVIEIEHRGDHFDGSFRCFGLLIGRMAHLLSNCQYPFARK